MHPSHLLAITLIGIASSSALAADGHVHDAAPAAGAAVTSEDQAAAAEVRRMQRQVEIEAPPGSPAAQQKLMHDHAATMRQMMRQAKPAPDAAPPPAAGMACAARAPSPAALEARVHHLERRLDLMQSVIERLLAQEGRR